MDCCLIYYVHSRVSIFIFLYLYLYWEIFSSWNIIQEEEKPETDVAPWCLYYKSYKGLGWLGQRPKNAGGRVALPPGRFWSIRKFGPWGQNSGHFFYFGTFIEHSDQNQLCHTPFLSILWDLNDRKNWWTIPLTSPRSKEIFIQKLLVIPLRK